MFLLCILHCSLDQGTDNCILHFCYPWGPCPLARTIKESIYIRVNTPTLNQNIGKYTLNHIWDRVLFNNPGLKLGSSQHPAVRH